MPSVHVGASSRGHSRAGSASNAKDLDDIFARLEPGQESYSLDRIDADDESPPLLGRSQVPLSIEPKADRGWGWR